MEVHVYDERKLAEIWLTKEEQQDTELKDNLQKMYRKCHEKGWMPVVFCSGREDLYQNTKDLLLYNRKRIASQQSRISMGI